VVVRTRLGVDARVSRGVRGRESCARARFCASTERGGDRGGDGAGEWRPARDIAGGGGGSSADKRTCVRFLIG